MNALKSCDNLILRGVVVKQRAREGEPVISRLLVQLPCPLHKYQSGKGIHLF